jgi:ABC-type multidrug transport system ATPase subunit
VITYAISHLTKDFGERTVLDIPDLEIEGERIYALLGPNGAGKTTLLNMLGFLEPPTAGQIRYRNRIVHFAEPNLQRLRKDVVVVDQHPILFTTTVYKNLEFGLRIRKVPKKERERIIEEAFFPGPRPTTFQVVKPSVWPSHERWHYHPPYSCAMNRLPASIWKIRTSLSIS